METTGRAPWGAERRAGIRVPADLTAHCRRLGRRGVDQDVRVVDLSLGGVRIAAPDRLQVKDVVELTLPSDPGPLTLRGLVVGTTASRTGVSFGHIAFTGLGAFGLERIGHLLEVLATGS